MEKVTVEPSPRFKKSFKKLSRTIQEGVMRALTKFLRDPYAVGLNFEAVTNRAGYFTIRVNRNFRVLLRATEQETCFVVVDVHNHDIYCQLE